MLHHHGLLQSFCRTFRTFDWSNWNWKLNLLDSRLVSHNTCVSIRPASEVCCPELVCFQIHTSFSCCLRRNSSCGNFIRFYDHCYLLLVEMKVSDNASDGTASFTNSRLSLSRFYVLSVRRQLAFSRSSIWSNQMESRKEKTFSFPFYVSCTRKRFKTLRRELNKVLRATQTAKRREAETEVNLS